jgi:mannose-6-phosphate isomerase-like protein (cupin superfamily)
VRKYFDAKNIPEYESISAKFLLINPKSKTSSQLHHRRAEIQTQIPTIDLRHGETASFDDRNDRIINYIPVGSKHKIDNDSDEPILIVELWCHIDRNNLSTEDDIVRFEDAKRDKKQYN